MTVAIETTETKIGQLTKMDCLALRKAHVASFHWSAKHEDYRWIGESCLRLTRRFDKDPYETEKTYEIACTSTLSDHAKSGQRAEDWGTVHAFDMVHTCQYTEEWQTFAMFAKPGDIVSFEWIKNNDSDTIRNAGLNHDQLRLRLDRKGKKFSFIIGISLCPSNMARMIRSH